MRLDATDPASVDAVVKAVAQAFGAPGILVNNAAITRDNLLMRMKEEEWTTILDTDLTSVYRLSKAVLRSMMKEMCIRDRMKVVRAAPLLPRSSFST